MRHEEFTECCGLTMARHLNTVDLSHWATSCRSTCRNSLSAIQGRHTMLPSLLIVYVTAYLQPQAVARLTAANAPWSHLLQDLMIPAGSKNSQSEITGRRPPLLLRPIRLRHFHMVSWYISQWGTHDWRKLLRVHVADYHDGIHGAISQWPRMIDLLDMTHDSHQLHFLLSAMVLLPVGYPSKYSWETELLRRLREHKRVLRNLHPRPRGWRTSSDSSPSSDSSQ
jgi:hypothetical protein